MSTLTKIGRRYHVRVKTTDGKHRTITTKAETKKEAEAVVKEAKLKEIEVAAKAGILCRKAVGVITTGRRLTVERALDAFEKALAIRRSPKTVANTMINLQCWMREEKIEKLPLSMLESSHVDNWVNKEDDTKAQTRRLRLSSIRSFMDYAIDRGYISSNPAGRSMVKIQTSGMTFKQLEPEKKVPFTELEVRRMLSFFDRMGVRFWKFASLISWEIGLRLGDICNLEWDCFNEPHHIIVHTSKTGKRIAVPISKELENEICLIPLRHELYVFPDERALNQDPARRATLSTYFKRYCERNGIHDKAFHCLRHACITRWAKEGKSLESIGKDVGHSSTKTTEGYVH